jgi:hypothetical protein
MFNTGTAGWAFTLGANITNNLAYSVQIGTNNTGKLIVYSG